MPKMPKIEYDKSGGLARIRIFLEDAINVTGVNIARARAARPYNPLSKAPFSWLEALERT
jgi:hypothetical protein